MIILGTELVLSDERIHIYAPESERCWIIFSRHKLPILVTDRDSRSYGELSKYLESSVIPIVSSLSFEDVLKMGVVEAADGDKRYCPIRILERDYDFILLQETVKLIGAEQLGAKIPDIFVTDHRGQTDDPAMIVSYAGWSIMQAPMTNIERRRLLTLGAYE